MVKTAVIGCGAWGTTLAKILAENGHEVCVWCHDTAIAAQINARENKKLLAGIALPQNIRGTTTLSTALDGARLAVIVTASQYFRQTAVQLKQYLARDCLLLSATKGLDETTGRRMSEVLGETLPAQRQNIAVLSGPNISREIAEQKVSAAVIASGTKATAEAIQKLFNNHYFRVYTNDDVIGVEIGGTVKNIIAIAAGIADGLGLGNNAKAALLVRGMVEIARLAVTLGGRAETIFGLTGMGDLITTCSSSLSRNHSVGVELAKGRTLADILGNMPAVAEGVPTTKLAHALAQKTGTPMPITAQMYAILYENKPVPAAVQDLMSRALKPEY
ncbi:MAG: NAD(P)-dependent glycerol-3-phosphate dehydrogenase [Candidatus Margulisbacteria bacterium]|jgi:glycerol-3-phosphate dehydrogenase (NAD(P)+)|nr:NAD(P)-dependent glycerol-3-phosphate dehydrogenase [Candidatus Margulisiibacteriota bacterium]